MIWNREAFLIGVGSHVHVGVVVRFTVSFVLIWCLILVV